MVDETSSLGFIKVGVLFAVTFRYQRLDYILSQQEDDNAGHCKDDAGIWQESWGMVEMSASALEVICEEIPVHDGQRVGQTRPKFKI